MVGYGSIGVRHTRVLQNLGCDTAVLSNRDVDVDQVYSRLDEALTSHMPHYVVIANQTNKHYDTLLELAAEGFSGRVLVEKPIYAAPKLTLDWAFKQIAVAYNLRFHPLIRKLRSFVEEKSVISVNVYVGQYLPSWRPSSDYRRSYSASASQGGVLRDLSHELDYLQWIFGNWENMACLGGKFSDLEINSDDLFVLLMQTSRCQALTIQMSYLDRKPARRIIVNTSNHTIELDLLKGMFSVDGKRETFSVARDDTYTEMHRNYISGDAADLCSLNNAVQTLELIEAAGRANGSRTWVTQ